jgi:hypothetical protein
VGRFFPIAAAAITLAAASCSFIGLGRPPVTIGGPWDRALPNVEAWAQGGPGRTFQAQDLDMRIRRIYDPLDSLIIADAYRRAGLAHSAYSRFPPAPKEAGRIVRENYIFYLRGNQIVGVEYRAVESDGWGGHRQLDEAVGEISESPPLTT